MANPIGVAGARVNIDTEGNQMIKYAWNIDLATKHWLHIKDSSY